MLKENEIFFLTLSMYLPDIVLSALCLVIKFVNLGGDPWVAQLLVPAFGPGHDPGDWMESRSGSLHGACF